MKELIGILAVVFGYGQEHSFITHIVITLMLVCFAQIWTVAQIVVIVFLLSGFVFQILGSMLLDNVVVDVVGV